MDSHHKFNDLSFIVMTIDILTVFDSLCQKTVPFQRRTGVGLQCARIMNERNKTASSGGCRCRFRRYLVVAFEAADHAGDLVHQAEVVDEVLQVLIQLAGSHVQFVCTENKKTNKKTHFNSACWLFTVKP